MIRKATEDMLPRLREIWLASFGDERYTDFIFHHLITPEQVLVHLERGKEAEAMLCVQPFTLRAPGGEAFAAYIYGVATLPESRGRGLSTALLEKTHRVLRRRGFALSALVPADEGLFGFYGARGYETAFSVLDTLVPAGEVPAAPGTCVLSPASLPALLAQRDAFYSGRALYPRWGKGYLTYIDRECRLLGGEVLYVTCAGRRGFAVCYPHEGTVVVKELAVDPDLIPDTLAALHMRYRADGYRLRLPGDTPVDTANKVLPFAMVRWYDKKKRERLSGGPGGLPFITHVLD